MKPTTKMHRAPLGRLIGGTFAVMLFVLTGCTPPAGEARLREAATLAGDGRFHLAIHHTEACLDAMPANPAAYVLHGITLYELQRQKEAIRVLRRGTEKAPDDFFVHFFYGWALCETGSFGDAVPPLRRAHELRAQCPKAEPDVLALLARAGLEQNLAESRLYLQALRRFQHTPEIYNALGVLCVHEGDYSEADSQFKNALKLDAMNAVVLQNLGVLHDAYLNDPTTARIFYRDALRARQMVNDSTDQAALRRRLGQLAKTRLQNVDSE